MAAGCWLKTSLFNWDTSESAWKFFLVAVLRNPEMDAKESTFKFINQNRGFNFSSSSDSDLKLPSLRPFCMFIQVNKWSLCPINANQKVPTKQNPSPWGHWWPVHSVSSSWLLHVSSSCQIMSSQHHPSSGPGSSTTVHSIMLTDVPESSCCMEHEIWYFRTTRWTWNLTASQ